MQLINPAALELTEQVLRSAENLQEALRQSIQSHCHVPHVQRLSYDGVSLGKSCSSKIIPLHILKAHYEPVNISRPTIAPSNAMFLVASPRAFTECKI